jgi:hypothetical protein
MAYIKHILSLKSQQNEMRFHDIPLLIAKENIGDSASQSGVVISNATTVKFW